MPIVDTRLGALLGVGAFYSAILFVGLWASRHRRGDSVSEVLVAGRRIPLWIGIITMTATWVDGGYLNGTAEAVYSRGLAWAQAPWGFALSLLLGGMFFAKIMHANGFHTMLDPFQQRYGERLGAVLYLPAMLGELFWTAGILAALGTTFGVLLDLDFKIAILVSAALTIAYTVRGGLWSIAYTDVLQETVALGGLLLCLPFVFSALPPLGESWALYQAKFGSLAGFFPPMDAMSDPAWGLSTFTWWDGMLLLVFGGIPWHCYFQRVLSCSSPQAARTLSMGAGLLCLVFAIPPALLGIAGAVNTWGPTAPDGFVILPTVLRDMTPGWVGLIGLCAVAGAIMSSVDASVYSAASMFSWNVVHRMLGREATPESVGRMNRRAILVVGCAATLMALAVQSVYALWYLSADLVYVLLFPQLVLVMYVRRVTRWGVASGLLVAFLLRLGGGEPMLGWPALLPYPGGPDAVWFPFKTFAMLAGLVTTLAMSRLPIPGGEPNAVPWLERRG